MQFHIKRHREEEDIILIPEILNFGTCAEKSFFERKIGQLQPNHSLFLVPLLCLLMKIFKMPQRQEEKPDITEIDLLRDIKILIRTQKARRKSGEFTKVQNSFSVFRRCKVSVKLLQFGTWKAQ